VWLDYEMRQQVAQHFQHDVGDRFGVVLPDDEIGRQRTLAVAALEAKAIFRRHAANSKIRKLKAK
jgi:hypothetical protein